MAYCPAWNPDYLAEYTRRIALLDAMESDPELRLMGMECYRLNPIEFINDWCITYNPRNTDPVPKILPFMLFQRQEDFIEFLMDCLAEKQSGLVEKSRDIGATWLCCAFSVWLWLFVPGAAVGWGSRKENLVDRLGDPDSIFEKMRMIINELPGWMLPRGFDRRFHTTSMKIINPETGAIIAGESGDQIGRGGRKMIYFKDEAAHYERPELIEASLGDNTDVQIDISSVNGTNNVFYRRRMAGEVWHRGITIARGVVRVFIFDWRDHPLKTQAWYDERRKKMAAEGLLHVLAQEVDRDYSASLDRVVIPASWLHSCIDAHVKLGFGEEGIATAGEDVADEGGDKHALCITNNIVKYIDHWGEGDTGTAARRCIRKCAEMGINELYYDSIGVGAGVKSEANRMVDEGIMPEGLTVFPWNAGGKVLNPEERIIPGDIHTPKNKDFFENLKAQGWWMVRQAVEKTHKAVTEGAEYHPGELLSLPSNLPRLHELIAELAGVTQKSSKSGKLMIDKKPDGGRSPNMADSLIIARTRLRRVSIFDSI